ncbi:hypothetical protein GGX14DRAFT_401404 [Mycena pura]|uniref:Uncharacterized protein n=1 Tax=Mycena pura TaxID=153505 RepID=A0AAD6Y6M4_9AGAR|nr:hypothetical protein GGX14DRAFT_401404 [Mycena pura]
MKSSSRATRRCAISPGAGSRGRGRDNSVRTVGAGGRKGQWKRATGSGQREVGSRKRAGVKKSREITDTAGQWKAASRRRCRAAASGVQRVTDSQRQLVGSQRAAESGHQPGVRSERRAASGERRAVGGGWRVAGSRWQARAEAANWEAARPATSEHGRRALKCRAGGWRMAGDRWRATGGGREQHAGCPPPWTGERDIDDDGRLTAPRRGWRVCNAGGAGMSPTRRRSVFAESELDAAAAGGGRQLGRLKDCAAGVRRSHRRAPCVTRSRLHSIRPLPVLLILTSNPLIRPGVRTGRQFVSIRAKFTQRRRLQQHFLYNNPRAAQLRAGRLRGPSECGTADGDIDAYDVVTTVELEDRSGADADVETLLNQLPRSMRATGACGEQSDARGGRRAADDVCGHRGFREVRVRHAARERGASGQQSAVAGASSGGERRGTLSGGHYRRRQAASGRWWALAARGATRERAADGVICAKAAATSGSARRDARAASSGKRGAGSELRAVNDGNRRVMRQRAHAAAGAERWPFGGRHGRRANASGRRRTRAAGGERRAAGGCGRKPRAGSWRVTDGGQRRQARGGRVRRAAGGGHAARRDVRGQRAVRVQRAVRRAQGRRPPSDDGGREQRVLLDTGDGAGSERREAGSGSTRGRVVGTGARSGGLEQGREQWVAGSWHELGAAGNGRRSVRRGVCVAGGAAALS